MRHFPGHTRQHCSLKAIRWRQLRPSFRMLLPSSSPAFAARFANRMAARTLQLRSNFDEFPAAYRTRGAASFFLPCFLFRHRSAPNSVSVVHLSVIRWQAARIECYPGMATVQPCPACSVAIWQIFARRFSPIRSECRKWRWLCTIANLVAILRLIVGRTHRGSTNY